MGRSSTMAQVRSFQKLGRSNDTQLYKMTGSMAQQSPRRLIPAYRWLWPGTHLSIYFSVRKWLTWENANCWLHSLFQKKFFFFVESICLFYFLGISCCFCEQAHPINVIIIIIIIIANIQEFFCSLKSIFLQNLKSWIWIITKTSCVEIKVIFSFGNKQFQACLLIFIHRFSSSIYHSYI